MLPSLTPEPPSGYLILSPHNYTLLPLISPPNDLLKALCGVGALSMCEGAGGGIYPDVTATGAVEKSGGFPLLRRASFLELINSVEAVSGGLRNFI